MPNKALSKAKISLLLKPDSTFFATVCFSLIHKFDDSIPTAATNGIDVIYNPTWFMSLAPDERLFIVLHETLHVCYLHTERLVGRDPRKWNIAADFVINLQLVDRGFRMPTGGCLDVSYRGMSAEQVYKLLPDNIDMPDEQLDLLPSKASPDELKELVADIMIKAQIQSRIAGDGAGAIPNDLAIELGKLLKPKLPWYQLLRKYVSAVVKDDYTYRKPNKRYMPDLYLPSLYSEGVGRIAIAVDTSGSVSIKDFSHFIAEITKVIKSVKPSEISLIQFDTKIISINCIKSCEELSKVKFKGRGGTSIKEVTEWVNKNKPVITIVFTDGMFTFKDSHSKLPILWAIHNNKTFKPKYGKAIHYEL